MATYVNTAPLSATLGTVTVGNTLPSGSLLTASGSGPVWTNTNYALSSGTQGAASIHANGTIKCKDLEIDDFSIKEVLKQLSGQVGLFIPPNIETLNVPAVQEAYREYRQAQEAFMKAKENLDLMVDLCRQASKDE